MQDGTAATGSLHGIRNTFESEAEPELSQIESFLQAGPGSHLIKAVSAVSRLDRAGMSLPLSLPPTALLRSQPQGSSRRCPRRSSFRTSTLACSRVRRATAHDPDPGLAGPCEGDGEGRRVRSSDSYHRSSEVLARPERVPDQLRVDVGGRTFTASGTAKVKLGKAQVLGMKCMTGSQALADVPYNGPPLWKASSFKAVMQQSGVEFRLTASRGTMEAGAKVMPFKVVFTPKDPSRRSESSSSRSTTVRASTSWKFAAPCADWTVAAASGDTELTRRWRSRSRRRGRASDD
jgi:hypothetical protein